MRHLRLSTKQCPISGTPNAIILSVERLAGRAPWQYRRASSLCKFTAPRSASRCAFMPAVDHRSSLQLRPLTGAGDNSSRAFNVCGMNGYGPFLSLDPSADRVSDPPVLHLKPFRTVALLGGQDDRPPPITPARNWLAKGNRQFGVAGAAPRVLKRIRRRRLHTQRATQKNDGQPRVDDGFSAGRPSAAKSNSTRLTCNRTTIEHDLIHWAFRR